MELSPNRRKREARLARSAIVAGWVLSAATVLIIAAIDVEVVVFTGPFIFLCGLGGTWWSARQADRLGLALALAQVAVSVLFFMLVVTLQWGPSTARFPFMVMGLAFVLFTAAPTWLLMRRPLPLDPASCETCGYLLYGLTEARCPECGTAFDPTRVTQPLT